MEPAARIVIVGKLDGFANSLKVGGMRRHLTARGHEVTVVDTYTMSRASADKNSLGRLLPYPRPANVLLFFAEWLARLVGGRPRLRSRLSYHCLLMQNALRRRILGRTLRSRLADLVIAEMPQDAEVLLDLDDPVTLYDCPTPWADELRDEGLLTPRQHAAMRVRERRVFEGVDHLSFHWHSYADYAVSEYGISGQNLMTLDLGCDTGKPRVRHADPPRIVYMGLLSLRFVNLPLLSRLCRLYPNIDVYGGPEPDPSLGVNYLGYAPPSVLQNYQLGLITCTDDELRRNGFSAKHIDYLSVGLPVLVPRWRHRLDGLDGSVPYDESDFLDIVDVFRDPAHWLAASDAAYSQAQRLSWETVLEPLDEIVAALPDVRRTKPGSSLR